MLAASTVKGSLQDRVFVLSALTRAESEFGKLLRVETELFDRLPDLAEPNSTQRADLFLWWIAFRSRKRGKVGWTREDYPLVFGRGDSDALRVRAHAESLGLIEVSRDGDEIRLSSSGQKQVDESPLEPIRLKWLEAFVEKMELLKQLDDVQTAFLLLRAAAAKPASPAVIVMPSHGGLMLPGLDICIPRNEARLTAQVKASANLLSRNGFVEGEAQIRPLTLDAFRWLEANPDITLDSQPGDFPKSLPAQPSQPASVVIHGSVGIVNTGVMNDVQNYVTLLDQKPETHELGKAIRALTDGITSDPAIPAEKKKEAIDWIATLGEEATKTPETRRQSVLKAAVENLNLIIGLSANAATIWQTWGPKIQQLLSIVS